MKQDDDKLNNKLKTDAKESDTSNNQENNINKQGFFKKLWYSIIKIEKYPDMAAQGLGKAMGYLSKVVAIMAIVLCIGMLYQTHNLIQQGVDYLQNEFPEFSYKDGILNVESETPIEIKENPVFGDIIIDTNTEEQETINQYLNKIGEAKDGIVVLKNEVRIKNAAVAGIISYSYKDTLASFKVNEFTKQDVINYINSSKMITMYVSVFITMFIYAFIMYFLSTVSNAILLSFFGYITTVLARIRMRFVAIFNMAVYALTLSSMLTILYIAVNIFVPFNMEYFQVMYMAVSAIYLVAAILILKTDFMSKQMELMKIAETQEIIKRQLEEKNRQDEEEQRKKEKKEKQDKQDKQEKKEEKKSDNNVGEEPQSSNA